MNISVLQENLSKAVSIIAHGVATRPQLPVLSNMLLRAQKGKLTLISTDLSIALGVEIGGKVEKEGAITVPAKDFALLVSNMPSGRVSLSVEKQALVVSSGLATSRMLGIAASEFPDIQAPSLDGVSVDIADFSKSMKRVLFCISPDEGRPILTGVKIDSTKQGQLQLISTDGYRLSTTMLSVKGSFGGKPIVVPGRVLSEALRLSSGDRLRLSVADESIVSFGFDNGWVTGRLLAGEFPPAEQIVPERPDVSIRIARRELEQAIKVAAVFAKESAHIIQWVISKKRLNLSARSAALGEHEAVLDIDGDGEGEISFNARYLLDWLSSADSDTVVFGMVGPLKPGLFTPAGDNSYRHVIMPVRTQPDSQEEQSNGDDSL